MSNNGGHLTVQYNLRWSEELRDRIAEEAKKNTRSMNQEIVARLEQSLDEKTIMEEEVVALTSQVKQLLDRLEGGKF
ncbi:Arc family DNA-binding protein [Acinetobacter sp. NIPH 1869]|uniref:Arc family DNA-binding protein n=1 Tax=Acinetobacter higginsii TaxID=70347 RepID=UPI001F4AA129|nr:Arc family DNA-binding protein [Acinetobacter higginsii]MCH7304784.1 Arc family DNA-binding protein [Acinetobacter higginsii]